jgi:ribokinase
VNQFNSNTRNNTSVLVIGTASLDILHLHLQQPSQTVHTVGGAGLYTALAVAKAGTHATLFAPKPIELPNALQPAAKLIEWIGPSCQADDLPRLEIAHYGNGKAELIGATWGYEPRMNPTDLPDDLSGYAFVHIAALSSAHRQLAFLEACRTRGAAQISVGTYARLVHNEPDIVRRLWATASLFFMNENECNGLFGSVEAAHETREIANAALFVTLGEQGVWVFYQNKRVHIPAQAARESDPTGAGDTFCGATLAALSRNIKIEDAARVGTNWASQTVASLGPAALL